MTGRRSLLHFLSRRVLGTIGSRRERSETVQHEKPGMPESSELYEIAPTDVNRLTLISCRRCAMTDVLPLKSLPRGWVEKFERPSLYLSE